VAIPHFRRLLDMLKEKRNQGVSVKIDWYYSMNSARLGLVEHIAQQYHPLVEAHAVK